MSHYYPGCLIQRRNNMTQLTAQQRARKKYEKEKRGKVVLRVQLSSSDNKDEWERIKQNLVEKYGTAKQGIYELAKKDNLI